MPLFAEIERRDQIMAEAIERAGPLVERHPEKDSFLEALLEQAIGRAITDLVSGAEIAQTGGGSRSRLGPADGDITHPDVEAATIGRAAEKR